MKVYDLHDNAKPSKGIEKCKAHIIGGGIAGLSAALFLTVKKNTGWRWRYIGCGSILYSSAR